MSAKPSAQDLYIFRLYLTTVMQNLEKKWRCEPTDIYLPKPCSTEN